MAKNPSITQLMDAEIRTTENRLTRLRAARALFDGDASPRARTEKPTTKTTRKRKPSADAIASGLVTTGGQLKDFGPKVLKAIKGGATTTKQVANVLFVTGLGLTRGQFRKRINVATYRLRALGQVKGVEVGDGTRSMTWTAVK